MPWRYVRPTLLRSDQLDVILAGRPCDEFLRRGDLLRTGGNRDFHAQSQLAFFPSPAFGASANPTLSATFESFGLVTKEAATVASIHIAHLPALNSARFSLNPFELAPGRTRNLHQVDIGGQGLLPFRRVKLRLPLFVEPARTERVGHGGEECHVLAPAGLASQAIPYTPADLSVSFFAASTTKSQVGFSGMVSPAFWNRSVRYIIIELSP